MATLAIASKANQATILPALLVASYVNESDPNASITIKFEDVETLQSGNGAAVELVLEKDSSTYGSDQVIGKLLEIYSFLQTKYENLVG